MVAHIRQVVGYAALVDKKPAMVRQVFAYAVVGRLPRFQMTAIAKDMMLSLINQRSTQVWTHSTLDISAPSNVSQGDSNAAITVSPKEGAQFDGSLVLYYKRIDFSRLFVDLTTSTPLTEVTSLQNALDQINARYNTHLTLDDVVPQTLSGQTSVVLTASAGSYLLKPDTTVTIGV